MGNISNVFYEEIPTDINRMMDTGEFYYHYNLMAEHPMFVPEYEEYEKSQIHTRNEIIGRAINRGELKTHPKMNTTIFGVSSIKNKSVIVTEY